MGRKHILLVEDDVDTRESLKMLLELEGFEVTSAGNGREGLEVLDEKGRPCLILLDLMMPVMNGWEFLERLDRERIELRDATPIVVVSAAADVGDAAAIRRCRVMKKPINVEALLTLARRYCAAAACCEDTLQRGR